ncbi:uncharacterized protein LOC132741147 [Ruditapes philippinarum]|jgi:hypothetical protein|uniref:uncharacterized protein LOC132741147 n=1 Tax=Ruditapes philippinarum TaxID=129788 RepID=UPI00295B12C6|nr:uncharacterized protein LOC132741147 [Ruditapes philippinarum]
MADASTSGRKVINQGTSGSNMTKDVDKQPDKLLSSSKSVASEGRKNESRGKVSTQKSQPPEKINDEVIKILQELNTNVTKQGSKLESLSKRVDDLYVEYDEYCYPDDSCNDGFSDSHSVLSNVSESGEDSQPPRKRVCNESDIFRNLCDKFQSVEKCDTEINDDLATFVNNSFRNGIADDSLSNIVKEIHRPVNCESLVKTKVNGCIWRLLKPQSQSDDVKFQAIQNVVVKAAINITKLLDKEGEKLDTQSIEWGTNALALLGQSNKLINNKRKECHRSDLDPRYYPLTSASLPFTENLYGDDINKSVKDIQDISKIGRDVGRNPSFRPFGRRRSGRPGMFSRGTGRGYFRPGHGSSVVPPPKNSRVGYKNK